MAKAYVTRNDRPGSEPTQLDFDSIGQGVETLAHCPTVYGHPVLSFQLLHPTGDMPWRAVLECRDSKSGEHFQFSVIFRD